MSKKNKFSIEQFAAQLRTDPVERERYLEELRKNPKRLANLAILELAMRKEAGK